MDSKPQEKVQSQQKESQEKSQQEKPKFDDHGHLPETDVPNRGELNVHPGQIVDKGTPVGQTRNENALSVSIARKQVSRAAKPTAADDPRADDPPIIYPSEDVSDDQRPENMAQRQTQRQQTMLSDKGIIDTQGPENKIYNRSNDFQGQSDHRSLAGADDGATPGSRSGNPLENYAENLIGDKVHDITKDGNTVLKVQTRDKSRAMSVVPSNEEGNDIQKLKVSFKFPPINHHVAQREFGIQVGNQQPAVLYLPPDNPNIEVLVSLNQQVHVELTHIDQDGKRGQPYILDFYSNSAVTPRPLEASPIGYELMETVLTKE